MTSETYFVLTPTHGLYTCKRVVGRSSDDLASMRTSFAFLADANTHYVVAAHGDGRFALTSSTSASGAPTVDIKIQVDDGTLVDQRDVARCDRCFDRGDLTLHRIDEMGACGFADDLRLCDHCDGDHENHCRCRDPR